MYTLIQTFHSLWAYLVVLVMAFATVNALVKLFGKKAFDPKDFRISLLALIVMHTQLLLGILLYFVSPYLSAFFEEGLGEIMSNNTLRLYLIEHPVTMLSAVVFVTIGYSKHKKKLSSKKKFKMLGIFYTLSMLLLLSMIPWKAWL